MEKAYNKYTFVNGQEPALSAQTLNDISNAIDIIDDRVVAIGGVQATAEEALMQAQMANAQTYENSRIAANAADQAMATTPTGYNQKMVQLNNLRNAPAYSSTKAYAVGDVVDYNDSIYKCKLACTNIKPTNTTYWEEVNVKTIEDDITRLNVDLSDFKNPTSINDKVHLSGFYRLSVYSKGGMTSFEGYHQRITRASVTFPILVGTIDEPYRPIQDSGNGFVSIVSNGANTIGICTWSVSSDGSVYLTYMSDDGFPFINGAYMNRQ